MGRPPKQTNSRLRAARLKKGMSLEELANKLGYHRSHLTNIELGRRPESPDIVRGYEKELGLPEGFLGSPDVTENLVQRFQLGVGLNPAVVTTQSFVLGSDPWVNKPGDLFVRRCHMLEQLLISTTSNDRRQLTVLMTSITEQQLIRSETSGDEELDVARTMFRSILQRVLGAGISIRHIWLIDPRSIDVVTRVQDMADFIGYEGSYIPMALRFDDSSRSLALQRSVGHDLLVVPRKAVFIGFASQQPGLLDMGMILSETRIVEAFERHFELINRETEPILRSFPDSATYAEELVRAHEQEGDLFIDVGRITLAAMPPSVYSALLQRNALTIPKPYIQHFEDLFWRYTRSFEQRLSKHRVMLMASKNIIERMIHSCTIGYSPLLAPTFQNSHDDSKPNHEVTIGEEEMRLYIKNTIRMLKTYPNFEICLVEKPDVPEARLLTITDKLMVIRARSESRNTMLDVAIYNRDVISAFRERFLRNWQREPSETRDREQVADWFAQKVNEIGKGKKERKSEE